MKKNQKGFTLIELLVVIAIIGILAALVLVALGNARNKANDARIKSGIGQLRTIAEVLYDTNNAAYTGASADVEVCFESPAATAASCGTAGDSYSSVSTLVADINTANGTTYSAPTANADATSFCVEAQLNDG